MFYSSHSWVRIVLLATELVCPSRIGLIMITTSKGGFSKAVKTENYSTVYILRDEMAISIGLCGLSE